MHDISFPFATGEATARSLPPEGTECTVALLMMPFGPSDRPSLGLSLLAQCLNDAGIPATSFYPNLDFERRIGPTLYGDLGYDLARMQAGEWLFSRLLDPIGTADDFIADMGRGRIHRKPAFQRFATAVPALLTQAEALLDDWLDIIGRMRPRVVGLSSCYQQHLASLAMAKRIKEAHPDILIVLGGTNCNEPMGEESFRSYPFLDAVVSGPGEIAFTELVRRHIAGERQIDLPGVFFRCTDGGLQATPSQPVAREPDLDQLPMPSFDDFLAIWDQPARQEARPAIPIEASRGCWWGQKHHCVFCSENAHSMRYRAKSSDRILAEFNSVLDRYPGSRICATDEILDLRLIETMMPQLAARPDKKRIFFSVKANLRRAQLVQLAAAGVTSLQPGIESLCDDILGPMRKGVTGLQNIQLLKWCRELGIGTVWGILCGFPFEKPGSYERMALLVPALTYLQPPKVSSVSLQRYSPLYTQAERFGIRNIAPHRSYRWIYRRGTDSLARLAYRFDRLSTRSTAEDDYTAALRREVDEWNDTAGQAYLFYVEDHGALLIGDTRPAARRRVHRLEGAARITLLFCDQVRSRPSIVQALDEAGYGMSDEELTTMLGDLGRDKLLIEDKGRYLGLAVRAGRHYLPPSTLMAAVVVEGRAARTHLRSPSALIDAV
ncbi:MAG: RiPP maturation radical SAM C-methyltransferase [Pseudomonadota bacterium]